MRPDDAVRIRHLRESTETALRFIEGKTRQDLETDEMLRLALTKLVEIVGEAAKHVSVETRTQLSSVPWSAAARMRDRLVHHYFDIDLDILWTTVTEEFPTLLEQLQPRFDPAPTDRAGSRNNVPTIDQIIDKYRHVDPDGQEIPWKREMWAKVWDGNTLPGREVLDAIDTEVAEYKTIRREWLRELADDDPIVFLAATTIWGYGNFGGRGIPALRSMLTGKRGHPVGTTVTEIIEASRTSAANGFSALFKNRTTKVSHLSIAFGTKVVHFAGYDHVIPRPLILDKRVRQAAYSLGLMKYVPDPEQFTTGAQYADYCEWAAEVADRNQVSPEQVEYALFRYGEA